VRLTIRDTGGGIPSDILPKIFDPYFTTKPGGTGLGLASVYSIITRHGGTMNVASEVGRGTEFVICLPAADQAALHEQHENIATGSSCFNAARVLVMDDEPMITEVATMMLSDLGCLSDACGDGAEAVILYKAARESGNPYDIVILDLTVPGGMGGLETARQIRKFDPDATLIVSSGYSQDAVMADFREQGFSGAVMKPYSMDMMSNELARVLKDQQLRHSRV
jgi:CheY-like chemotaxis protein